MTPFVSLAAAVPYHAQTQWPVARLLRYIGTRLIVCSTRLAAVMFATSIWADPGGLLTAERETQKDHLFSP